MKRHAGIPNPRLKRLSEESSDISRSENPVDPGFFRPSADADRLLRKISY
jgi:hypothetical protein